MSCRNVDQTTGLFVSGVQELSTIFLPPSSQKNNLVFGITFRFLFHGPMTVSQTFLFLSPRLPLLL